MKRPRIIFLLCLSSFLAAGCLLKLTPAPTLDQPASNSSTPTETALPSLAPTSTSTPAITIWEAQPVNPILGMPEGSDGLPWWNDSIFYEIFVRSFYDSNGDGIGDLNGITQKLDYLNDGDPSTDSDLGVTGIWLMPIFPSPSYHGYDVMDYTAVNPEFGTMDDFLVLLESAHQRGIRVIIDLVLNHTSRLHPWFLNASNPSSPYHSWYIWSNTNPGYQGSWNQNVWFPLNGRYFYSTFSAGMPDLNYLNPEVVEQMNDVIRFWLLDIGVDGFRIDAAKHIIEEGQVQANSDSTHHYWEQFRPFIKEIAPQSLQVGEVWEDTPIMAEYLQGDEFDLSFEFYLAGNIIEAINNGKSTIINNRLKLADSLIPNQQFAVFLSNHDQDRVMSQLFDDEGKMKAAASVMLTAPGVPFLYYGEEIGMQGDQIHEWVRRPMQWNNQQSAGFSTGTLWQPLGPAWQQYNVQVEQQNDDSLLSHYKDLIRIRNQHAALRVGALDVIHSTNQAIYSIIRVSSDETILVLVNVSGEPVEDIWLIAGKSNLVEDSYKPVPIWGQGNFPIIKANTEGGFYHHMSGISLPAYETLFLQLQPVEP